MMHFVHGKRLFVMDVSLSNEIPETDDGLSCTMYWQLLLISILIPICIDIDTYLYIVQACNASIGRTLKMHSTHLSHFHGMRVSGIQAEQTAA